MSLIDDLEQEINRKREVIENPSLSGGSDYLKDIKNYSPEDRTEAARVMGGLVTGQLVRDLEECGGTPVFTVAFCTGKDGHTETRMFFFTPIIPNYPAALDFARKMVKDLEEVVG